MDIGNISLRIIILKKFNNKCAYCGGDLDLSNLNIDHISPKNRKSKGKEIGDDSINNFNPSCFTCNSSKGNLSIDEWRNAIENKNYMCFKNSATYRVLIHFNRIIEIKEPIEFYFEKIKKDA